MKVVLIGSGNTATVLSRKIKAASHEILQVFSRKLSHAAILADILHCAAADNWNLVSKEAQLYIVALTDTATEMLHAAWHSEKGMVVHTAGSVPMNVLEKVSKNYGVLYPLQSMRKEKVNYADIPFLVDANSNDGLAVISDFAASLSPIVQRADDAYRSQLHVAAVIVNNFTNHIYALAEAYCNERNLSFELLKPLIMETAERINDFPASMVQTGPAYRHDESTIEKHLHLLSQHAPLHAMYRQMTESIRLFYSQNENTGKNLE